MKKIDNISDTDEDLDETRRKEMSIDAKDQIVPMSDKKSEEDVGDFKETELCKQRRAESESVTNESCQDVPENLENINANCELDVISSPESYQNVQSPECFSPRVDSACNKQENHKNNFASNYDEEPYDPEDSLQSYETDYLPENYVTEDSSSLPVSETTVFQKEENEGSTSSVHLPSPVEDSPNVAPTENEEEEEDREEQITRVFSPTANEGIENDAINSSMSYFISRKESESEENEEVRCSSRGETVLVMNGDLCSENCELAKPNICTSEEVTYRDHLNSIERVDGIVFHTRSSVIDAGSTSAPVFPCESSIMKYREGQCGVTERGTEVRARYSGQYSNEYVECPVPKRICNSVPMPVLDQKSSGSEMYVYNTSIQNVMLCSPSSDCERDIHPANVNGLHAYSFHRVSPECCSNTNDVDQSRDVDRKKRLRTLYSEKFISPKVDSFPSYCTKPMINIAESFSDSNTDLCSVVQDSNYEERALKLVRKIPSEEDFMRRIEKTLFESKIEPKEDDLIESKYKSELDLSLPLKKRLRTLYSEKFISPKVDSFPSYRAKPMINIAELLPQTTKSYEENYK